MSQVMFFLWLTLYLRFDMNMLRLQLNVFPMHQHSNMLLGLLFNVKNI